MSFDQESHMVPHKLEDPIPVMFWSPMEFTMAISLMGFGLIMDMWPLGMGLGGAVLVGSRYLARGAKRGAVQHLIWNLGLKVDPKLSENFPPAWVNEFIC